MNVLIEQMSLVTLGVSRDIRRKVLSSSGHGCNCCFTFLQCHITSKLSTVYDDLYAEIIILCLCMYMWLALKGLLSRPV